MKRCACILLGFFVFIPSLVVASEFVIHKSFEFLAVNGEDLDPGILAWNRQKSVELEPGVHKIALKYYEVMPDKDNPRVDEFISSDPMLITLRVQANRTYRLVPHPDLEKSPREYAQNPRLKIVDDKGRKANYELALLIEQKESVWSKVTQSEGQKVEPKSKFAELTSSSAPAVAATAPVSGTSPTAAPANGAAPAGSMLQYWWSQADEKTRQEFMRWVYTK